MRFLHNILAKAGLIVDGVTQLNTIANATIDTDKFLVSDGGVIKYRTGAELGSDIGAANLAASTLKHQVKLGEAINKGQAVYVSSADGTNMIVSKASNASEATSSKTLGLIETSGVLNDQVNVITEGLLAGLDTSTANAGDPVWLGTGGNLIFGLANKPYAPAHLVFIGIVTRVQQNNGEIFVKVQNGFELKEIHDVQITTTPSNNTVLAYESATSLYKMKSIATLLGYTPADDSLVVHLAGTETITGAKTFSSALTLSTVANATIDTDRFLVSDSGVVKYRTGAEVLSDIGAQPLLTNPVTGTGTTNYLAKFTSSSAVGNSQLFDNGTNVGINTASPSVKLDVVGGNGDGIQYRTSTRAIGIGQVSNEPSIFWGSGTPLTFLSGGELMRITSGGALLVGTTSNPYSLGALVVNHNSSLTRTYFQRGVDLIEIVPSDGTQPNQISSSYTISGSGYKPLSISARQNQADLYLTTGGLVGIGTTSPSYKLDINGQTRFQDIVYFANGNWNKSGDGFNRLYFANAGRTYFGSGNGYEWRSDGDATLMVLTNGGNVGIGTTSPAYKLQAVVDNSYSTLVIAASSLNGNVTGGLTFGGIYNSDDLNFYSGGSFTEKMRIKSSGLVGIGTGSPSYNLHISSASNETGIGLTSTATGGRTYRIFTNPAWGAGSLQIYDATADVSRISIFSNGNVAINSIVDGGYRLDVSGTARVTSSINIGTYAINRSNSGGYYTGTSDNFGFSYDGAAAYVFNASATPIILGTSNTERIRITAGGSVGIGTSSPQAKLQVTNSTSDGIIISTTANVEPFLAFWRNSASNGVGVLRLIDGGNLYFDNGATGAAQSTKMQLAATGAVRINSYGSGSFTGTRAYDLSVDASGNIIEVPVGAGTITGTGTTNYLPKFTSSSAIGNSLWYEETGVMRLTGTVTAYPSTGNGIELYNADASNSYIQSYNRNATTWNDLYFRGKTLLFATNGSERMRLDASGNLGLGTSAPSGQFHTYTSGDKQLLVTYPSTFATRLTIGNAAFYIQNDASPETFTFVNSTGSGIFDWKSGASATQRMRLDASGNLLVGGTSADRKLVVTDASTTGTGVIQGIRLVGNAGNYYDIGRVSNTGEFTISGNQAGTPLFTLVQNSAERLRVDASGNLGIGTSAPSFALDVATATARIRVAPSTTTNYALFQATNAGNTAYLGLDNSTGGLSGTAYALNVYHNGAYPIVFSTSGINRMWLDASGNLGLGTSAPSASYKFTISGTDAIFPGLYLNNTTNSKDYSLFVGGTSLIIRDVTSAANRLTLTASGNLGLGVSPSAWLSAYKAIQFGIGGALIGRSDDAGIELSSNAYRNSVGSYNYLNTSASTSYRQYSGSHQWFTAPSGTAGNAISFTQAMTLDASGRLGIGVIPVGSDGLLNVNIGGSTFHLGYGANYDNYYTSGASGVHIFRTGGSERMRITSGGNVGIGTTSPGDKLQVDGNVYATAFHAVGSIARFVSGGGTFIAGLNGSSYGSIQSYSDASGTGRALAINPSGGNVGIGTTSPSYKLDVVNAGTNTIRVQNTSNTSDAYLLAQNTLGSTFFGINATGGYIYNGGALPILFYTSGNERMRLDASGNLGIGTSSPTVKLDIEDLTTWAGLDLNGGSGGEIRLQKNGTTYGQIYASDGASTGFVINAQQSGNSMQFQTAGVERARITSGGNLLVGTATSDGSQFRVYGGYITLGDGAYEGLIGKASTIISGGNVGDLGIRSAGGISISSGGNTERVRITSTGNVGIGTSSPTSKLQVLGTGRTLNVVSTNDQAAASFGSSGYAVSTIGFYGIGSANDYNVRVGASVDAFVAYTNDTERMRITSGGNVGIGTTSPTVSGLTVSRTGDSYVRVQGGSATYTGLDLLQGVDGVGYLWNRDNTAILFGTNNTERMRLTAGGNLLVGTTTDAGYKLDVNGTGRFSASYSASGSVAIETWQRIGGAVSADITYNDANTSMNFGTNTPHSLNLKTNNNTALTITSGGNVGIGTTSVNASAKLQVESTTQGFLPPRMTQTQRDAITTPATGLIIFQTDNNAGFYFYNGTAWKALAIVQ